MRMLIPLLALSLLYSTARGEIVINEVHYNPEQRGQPLEFIELFNSGDTTIDLTGWRFDRGITFTFPDGTKLAPAGYLVVAESPEALQKHYQQSALGPWEGRLSNRGERLTLVNNLGKKVDEVEYSTGFPWPSAAAGGGASMELVHSDLDNDLGGSWRSSVLQAKETNRAHTVFVPAASRAWRYFKGTREPPADWLKLNFDDTAWQQGQTPLGYADGDDRTRLTDMRNRYGTVFLRHTFHVSADHPLDRPLTVRVYDDDGAVVWINGVEVARHRVIPSRLLHRSRTSINHEAAWEMTELTIARSYLRPGKNIIAVLGVNGNLASSDFSIDASLAELRSKSGARLPSPGAPNHARSDSPPPQVRQVKHSPKRPSSGEEVTISAKITDPDDVTSVSLRYQRIAPGSYLAKDNERYESTWESLTMSPSKEQDVYQVIIPGDWQKHRHLFRYQIVATDKKGARVQVPYTDDDQPNFAYFCYDGAPAWTGSNQPNRTNPLTFSAQLLNNTAPILNLIAQDRDVEDSQYNRRYNEEYFYGTLVVGETVYDHIRFRNRGETTTYAVGKNKWRINFNRTHEFDPDLLESVDQSGKRRWKRLNLNPGTVPYHPQFRGNASLNERLVFKLYQLAGIPSPDTAYAQLRVVDAQSEQSPSQYDGDPWGLYMAFEAIDGFLLDNRNQPDGELVRMKQSGNVIARTAPTATRDGMNFNRFWYELRDQPTAEWWSEHVDLERYFSFHAISIVTARVDQKLSHNHYLYHHPTRGWQALPWDADLSMRTVRHVENGLRWHPTLKYCLQHPAHRIAFQNRARELLDLLFQKDQIDPLVDELVKPLGPVNQEANLATMDGLLWNHHPYATRRHRGTFYLPSLPRAYLSDGHRSDVMIFDGSSHAARVAYFKDYLTHQPAERYQTRGKSYRGWGYRQLLEACEDPNTPETPVVKQLKSQKHLRFTASPFFDRQGARTFSGIRWRIASAENEVKAVWESEWLDQSQRTSRFQISR